MGKSKGFLGFCRLRLAHLSRACQTLFVSIVVFHPKSSLGQLVASLVYLDVRLNGFPVPASDQPLRRLYCWMFGRRAESYELVEDWAVCYLPKHEGSAGSYEGF